MTPPFKKQKQKLLHLFTSGKVQILQFIFTGRLVSNLEHFYFVNVKLFNNFNVYFLKLQ